MTDEGDQPKVLIVDDEERVANIYNLRLQDDYNTEVVHNGTDALEVVDNSFDVVLLDRRMPGMNGSQVLEEIRNRNLDTRVVMVTAVDPDFDIADMDVDDYVVKPVEMDQLHEVVERALTIAEYNEQMQELNSLRLRRNVLEVELDERDLEESEEYGKIVDRIDDIEDGIEDMEATLEIEHSDLYL